MSSSLLQDERIAAALSPAMPAVAGCPHELPSTNAEVAKEVRTRVRPASKDESQVVHREAVSGHRPSMNAAPHCMNEPVEVHSEQ